MIRKKTRIEAGLIDCTGSGGEIRRLISNVRVWSHQLGKDPEPIIADMLSKSNYNHLVNVVDKHFGDFVLLEEQETS